ncbi:hypothetical protein D3C71_1545080 [compost metagenome]
MLYFIRVFRSHGKIVSPFSDFIATYTHFLQSFAIKVCSVRLNSIISLTFWLIRNQFSVYINLAFNHADGITCNTDTTFNIVFPFINRTRLSCCRINISRIVKHYNISIFNILKTRNTMVIPLNSFRISLHTQDSMMSKRKCQWRHRCTGTIIYFAYKQKVAY